jgi:hypothetical protein
MSNVRDEQRDKLRCPIRAKPLRFPGRGPQEVLENELDDGLMPFLLALCRVTFLALLESVAEWAIRTRAPTAGPSQDGGRRLLVFEALANGFVR